MIRALSTDLKKNQQKYNYSLTSSGKNINNNKISYYSSEKECLDINALVKQSVDKINDLFNNKILTNEKNDKQIINSSNDKKLDSKANFTFNINNFINVRNKNNHINQQSQKNKNNTILTQKYKKFNSIKNIKIKNKEKKNISLSQEIIDNDNKNKIKIKLEDELSENINFNKNKNVNSIIDISTLKRNIRKHSINLSNQFDTKNETKNQIDYIKQSNQNQKIYIIKSSYNLNDSKKSNELNTIGSKMNLSLQNNKRDYSFIYKITKESHNNNNSKNKNLCKKQNNRLKFYNLYKRTNLSRINNNGSRNNIKIANSTKNLVKKKNYKQKYERSSSLPKKVSEKKNLILNKNKTLNNSPKKFNRFNFMNIKIQNANQFKIFSSNSTNKKQNNIYHTKTQNIFHNRNNSQFLKNLYSKEFPSKIKTNDVLKLMLFLNEYIINNNLLDDYYLPQNRQILDEYSKFLSSKIFLNYAKENDISIDNVVNKTKIIQRNWRKRKIKNYLQQNKYEEEKEMKKMIVNNYIEKSGYTTKKMLGLFHNLIENFYLTNNNDKTSSNKYDINKIFYYIQKLIMKDLTTFEKNELYKDYINNIIYKK